MQAGMGERRSLAEGWSHHRNKDPWQWPCREREADESQEGWPGHPGHRQDQPPWGPYILGLSHPSNKGFLCLGLWEAEREERGYGNFLPEGTTSRFWQTNLESAFGTKTICLRASKYFCQTCSFINTFSSFYDLY